MLRPRIIPCLLIHNNGLVKTVNFSAPRYVGDPINAVRILNEKAVDELIVLDIDATLQEREPDYKMIRDLATECRMPLCYGGGVKTSEQVQRIIQLGVEKVALSSEAVANPDIIADAAKRVGNQSIVVVLDVKKEKKGYEVFTHRASRATGRCPVDLACKMEKYGAGEIVINSIDNDGIMRGYDIELVDKVRSRIGLPLTVLGGAGSLDDIRALIHRFGILGAAAGSIFVFKGSQKAVLINYPRANEKRNIAGLNSRY